MNGKRGPLSQGLLYGTRKHPQTRLMTIILSPFRVMFNKKHLRDKGTFIGSIVSSSYFHWFWSIFCWTQPRDHPARSGHLLGPPHRWSLSSLEKWSPDGPPPEQHWACNEILNRKRWQRTEVRYPPFSTAVHDSNFWQKISHSAESHLNGWKLVISTCLVYPHPA